MNPPNNLERKDRHGPWSWTPKGKLGAMGAVIGLFALAPTLDLAAETRWLAAAYPLFGWLLGYFLRDIIDNWLAAAKQVGIQELTFDFPFVGEAKISLTNAQAAEIRKLYMELTNRVVVQSLNRGDGEREEATGLLREALSSLHASLLMVRETLKELPANDPAGQGIAFELALRSLINDVFRPYLSRWHPRLKAWEDSGLPESIWPLADLCREDLEITRRNALVFVWRLAVGLKIEEREAKLLQIPPAIKERKTLLPLVDIQAIDAIHAGMAPSLEAVNAENAWNLLVELASLAPWVEKSRRDGLTEEELLALLQELPGLMARARRELKALPVTAWAKEGQEALEAVALRLLQQRLQPFVVRFTPGLQRWLGGSQEAGWGELEACSAQWASLAKGVADDLAVINRLTDDAIPFAAAQTEIR